MKPLRNNVVVVEVEEERTTASGLILTGSTETGSKPAKVVAVGPDTIQVKIGDVVYLKWTQAMAVTVNGLQGAIVSEDYVEAIK